MRLRIPLLPLLAAWVAAWSGALPAQEKTAPEKVQDSPYYPLRVNTRWVYRAGEQRVVLRVSGVEKVDGIACAVLETKSPGGLPITEHLAPHKDGVYRFKAMNLPLDPPLCVLKLPSTKERVWQLNSRLGGELVLGTSTLSEAEVSVPYGKYQALVVRTELQRGDQKFTITTYFARGVGMVKQTQSLGNKEIVLELEKFEEMK